MPSARISAGDSSSAPSWNFTVTGSPAAAALPARTFEFPLQAWVQILYELAATFHTWTRNRFKIIELVTPLYYARVANFVRRTWDMSSEEAERFVEEQALEFENQKDYLVKIWDEKKAAART